MHRVHAQDTFLVLTTVWCLPWKMLFRKPERELMTGRCKDLIFLLYCWHSVFWKICKNTPSAALWALLPRTVTKFSLDFKHLLQVLKDRLITWLQVMTECFATFKLKLLHKSSASLQCCAVVLQHCTTSPGQLQLSSPMWTCSPEK